MSFDVAADAYTRFMGRFAAPLADEFVALVDPRAGQRALDVGCGPGALTSRLVERLGADAVLAIDPSAPFVAAARERFPGADIRQATAEDLPFADNSVDLALAQLVVLFMADPVLGLGEMTRVTRPGGLVSASVWDHVGERSPLSPFWLAVRTFDPSARDESGLAGVRRGHLVELFTAAGLTDVRGGDLTIRVPFQSVEQYWEPFELGVGPAGAYVATLGPEQRDELKQLCAAQLPEPPFDLEAAAWVASARV